MSDAINTDAVNWICHSSIDDARRFIRAANDATCVAALDRLAQLRRRDGQPRKVLNGLLKTRISRLASAARKGVTQK